MNRHPAPLDQPDGLRLRSSAFVALFAAALAFFIAGGTVLPVAARFAAGPLAADATGVGIAIGAFSVAALAMRPVVGWASDRYGRRPLLLLGGAVTVAALAAHLVADTLPSFVAVRALLGIGEAFFFVAAVAAITDLAPPERRGEAINIGSLSVYLGLAAGPVIGETILSAAGFSAVWLAAAAVALLATCLAAFVPESAPVFLPQVETAGARRRPRARLFHPAGLFPGFLILTGAWGMAGFFAFMPLHAPASGMSGAGPLLAMYALIVIALRIAFVKLPDQIGAARLSATALAVSAVGLLILGTVGGELGLIVGTIVFALGIAFMFPALLALAVSRVDDAERGTVVGTTTVFLDLSFGLAPALLGVIADASGIGMAFIVAAGVSAFGSVLLVVRRRAVAMPSAV